MYTVSVAKTWASNVDYLPSRVINHNRLSSTGIEEAVGKLIAERQNPPLDISVRDALKASMQQFGPLYKRLAE